MNNLYFVVTRSVLDETDNMTDGIYAIFSQINVGNCKMCRSEEEAIEFVKGILQIESIDEDSIEIITRDDGTIYIPFVDEIRCISHENEDVLIFIASFEELD